MRIFKNKSIDFLKETKNQRKLTSTVLSDSGNKHHTSNIMMRLWTNNLTSVSFSYEGFGVNFYSPKRVSLVMRIKCRVLLNFVKGQILKKYLVYSNNLI